MLSYSLFPLWIPVFLALAIPTTGQFSIAPVASAQSSSGQYQSPSSGQYQSPSSGQFQPTSRPDSHGEFSNSNFNRIPFRNSGPLPTVAPVKTRNPGIKASLSSFSKTSFSRVAPVANRPSPRQDNDPIRTRVSEVEVKQPIIKFIDDIHLPAMESGVIESLGVKEGEFIPAKRIIGKIDDEMFQLALKRTKQQHDIALMTADDDISIQAAEKEFLVRKVEADIARKLAKSRSKSQAELRLAIFQEEIAFLKITKAKKEKEMAISQAKLAEAQLQEVEAKIRRHQLVSPFDGYVIEIFKMPQEFVNPGEDVIRIARMDRLWVQGIVDIDDLNPHEALDRPVTVTVTMARGEIATFQGKIVNVALERQSPTSFLVKAEIQNRPIEGHWTLQPNSEVTMTIHLDQDNGTSGSGTTSGNQ